MENKYSKYFIINYGPPASGKGSIKTKIFEYLEIKDYVDVNVDNFVVKKCEEDNTANISICNTMNQEQYKKYRVKADELSDYTLNKGLEEGKHILWETTGNSVDWTISTYIPLAKKHGYKIVISFPIVKYATIKSRCENRAQAANCSTDYLTGMRNNSYKNFKKISPYCDIVLIYDNNDAPKLIYSLDGLLQDIAYIGGTDTNFGFIRYSISSKLVDTHIGKNLLSEK